MNVLVLSTSDMTTPFQKKEKIRVSFAWLIRGGIAVSLILMFIYLILLNALASQGFTLQKIKEDRLNIQKEVEKWDISLAIPVSLYALESNEQVQNMEQIKTKEYVMINQNGQIAMNQ